MSHLKGSWGPRVYKKFLKASQRSLRTKDQQKGSDSLPSGSDGHLEGSKGHLEGSEGHPEGSEGHPVGSEESKGLPCRSEDVPL